MLNFIVAPILLVLLLLLIYKQITSQGNIQEEWNDFLKYWTEGNKVYFILIILLAPLNWTLESIKWKLLLRKVEQIPFRKAFASVLTGMSFAIITPNKIGDFAGRILYLKNKTKLQGAIATLIGNLAHTIATFTFGIAGLIYFNIYYSKTWSLITLALALIGIGILLYFYLRMHLLAKWIEKYPKLRVIAISFRVLKRYSKRDLLQIVSVSACRFMVYNVQFFLLINLLGAQIPFSEGVWITAVMFWMITVIPSFFIADIGVRGFIAGLLFIDTGISENAVSVLAGSYMVWLMNLIIPAIIGSFLILTVRIIR